MNAGVDHAVALDSQREQSLWVAKHLRWLERAIVVLLREDRLARRHAAEHGNGAGRRGRAAGDPPAPLDVAGLLEDVEVVADAVRGRDAEGLANLANRWRKAFVAAEGADEVQDFA